MTPDPLFATPFLVVACVDGYVPQLVPAVLGVIDAYDTETVRVIVETMAWVAREEMAVN